MPKQLIRLTIDQGAPGGFIVEYGGRSKPGLSAKQKKEYDKLNAVLMEYQEFSTAEQLQEEDRQKIMEQKKRFEELSRIAEEERITWTPVDPKEVMSILLILKPSHLPTYVENLPNDLMDKLFSANLNIQQASIILGGGGAPLPTKPVTKAAGPLVDSSIAKVIPTLQQADENWAEVVDVYLQGNIIIIKPKKFLKERWTPLNVALRQTYGDCWKSKGKADKDAHWEVPA